MVLKKVTDEQDPFRFNFDLENQRQLSKVLGLAVMFGMQGDYKARYRCLKEAKVILYENMFPEEKQKNDVIQAELSKQISEYVSLMGRVGLSFVGGAYALGQDNINTKAFASAMDRFNVLVASIDEGLDDFERAVRSVTNRMGLTFVREKSGLSGMSA